MISILLLLLLALCTPSCGGDGSDSADGDAAVDGDSSSDVEQREPVCEAGKVVECPCAGGGKGVQTCDDDGSKWGECTGCPETDGDMSEQDTAENDAEVDGDQAEIDGDDSDGDMENTDGETDSSDGDSTETENEVEPEVEVEIEAESGLSGRCSASGIPCDEEVPCETATYEVHGVCSVSSMGSNNTCIYAPRRPTGLEDFTCGDVTQTKCESNFDCPDSIGCGGVGSGWCSSGSDEIWGICLSSATLNMGSTPCVDDSQCTQTISNVCVICGNANIDSNQEKCDDGNLVDSDGCSNTCQFNGVCYNGGIEVFGSECAEDNDCSDEMECNGSSCTCQF